MLFRLVAEKLECVTSLSFFYEKQNVIRKRQGDITEPKTENERDCTS